MHPILLNTNISQQAGITATPIFGVMDQNPYGYWNQTERWGSQNGLTYMWPMVHYTLYGSCGPKVVDLNNGNFPKSNGALVITEQAWPGIGNDPYTAAEIDGSTYPWNSATGYIGLTFGGTGFLDIRTAQRIVTDHRWIPEKYRVMSPYRLWRYLTSQAGIAGTEDITLTSGVRKSHWIKRKISFMRAELKAFGLFTGSTGFIFGGGIENDDEYADNFGFSDLNDTVNFPNQYVYPNNSPTGNSWYASFSGQSAAPDSLIAEGITSFQAFLLTRGWTTGTESFKWINGIKAVGGGNGVSGNIAPQNSRDMWLGREFSSALKDWTAAHWQDLFDDFKKYNGHTADNNLYGSYGYYHNNAGISGYRLLNPLVPNSTFLTNTFNIGSTDAIPYPLSPTTQMIDRDMQRYYSYDNSNPYAAFPGSVYSRLPGSISSLNTYGAFPGPSVFNSTYMLDRTLDYTGNSYYFANNGQTFGIKVVYGFMMDQRYSTLGSPLNSVAKKWLPANYLGTTTGLPSLVDCRRCSEIVGSCHFRQFDITGSSGSTFPIALKSGFDRAPELQSWHFNPVWGITFIPATASYGPANYIPVLLTEIISGLSYGQISLKNLAGGQNWGADQFDACLNPYPGNTLPAGTLYKDFWTHWYPMHFVSLLEDVARGRHLAVNNVTRAIEQRNNAAKNVPNSIWNGIQKPINIWIAGQKWYGDTAKIDGNYYIPTGLTFGYYIESFAATGMTFSTGEAGPLYYENMRHQYLNKTARFSYWSIFSYTCVTTSVGPQPGSNNQVFPRSFIVPGQINPPLANGLTSFGVCGAIAMALTRKVNTVIGECDTVGNGLIRETVNLAPINLDERNYLASGAQTVNGNFLWRITFAHPATDPSQIIIRGSCSGITTGYSVSGITDYINNPNNKFGVWWTTANLEYPIVNNPPIPEAIRLNTVSLPENPKFMFDAQTTSESRNLVPKNYVNPDLFCTLGSPYGFWKQTERWGSQNGLTYMWPNVEFIRGNCGPSQTQLNAGIFPTFPSSSNITTDGWTGVGTNNNPDIDIDMSQAPWNTPTGYLGLTFGAPGFYSIDGVNRVIRDYSWIPNKYRVVMASRWWRAESNSPLPDTEVIGLTGDRRGTTAFKTPWLKRKMNFLRAELKAIYLHMSARGFTMAHFDLDDEIYGLVSDYRGIGISGGIRIGDSNFYTKWLYPSNRSSGNKWYADFYGASAAPDCFITRGITSMRAHLLAKGFTSNPGNWRYVEGLTAIGGSIDNVPGNLAGDGSFEILGYEHQAAIKDWFAGHWTDLVDDFKFYNGISADNSLSGDYGYYKLNNAVINFTDPSYTNNFYVNNTKDHISDALNRTSSDYVPFVTNNIISASDKRMQDYYQYNDAYSLDSCQNVYTEQVGDIGVIHAYGGNQADIDPNSNAARIIDRNLDWRGNTYGLVVNGITYGKNVGGWYSSWIGMVKKYGANAPEASTAFAKKFVPANWLGNNTHGQTLQCYSCAEIMGSTGFFKYDPNGSNGSCAASITKVGFDRAPHYVSWHLNPVWGINVNRFSSGQVSGPANYIPLYGPDTLNGLSFGAKTRYWMGDGATFNVDKIDPCGNPFPGNTLPAGTIYNHYWTNWYPMGYMALITDVKWGRQVAKSNVAKAVYERNDPINHPKIPGSNWYGIQKPINTWVAHQRWTSDYDLDISNNNTSIGSAYYIPEGITFGYRTVVGNESGMLDGFTFMYGEAGPMYYENIRHQYLNKTGRYSYWNPSTYDMTASDGTPLSYMNESACFGGRYYGITQTSPQKIGGLTCMGICGAIKMALARKINTVIGECQTIGNGTVWETTYLAPMNMDDRSYVISGAQKVDGNYVWRITFAHPATQSPIIVRGSVSGITTAYYVNGITNYIGTPNNKFGIWWNTDRYEIPIVENPPVSEAERLGVLNLPGASAFSYNPLTMTQAVEAFNGIEVVTDIVNLSFNATERSKTIPPMLANNIKYGQIIYGNVNEAFGPNFTVNKESYKNLVRTSLNQFYGNTADKNYFGIDPYHLVLDYEGNMTDYINGDVDPIAGSSCAKAIGLLNNLLTYTREVSPNSIIYEYNCPSMPYYFAFITGDACTWGTKPNAVSLFRYDTEKSRLITQHQSKIALFKANTDRVDIEAYPKYTDAFISAKGTDAASSQLIYNNTLSASQALLNNYPKTVPTQIFCTFEVFEGSEYLLTGTASNAMTGYTSLQNYQSLVSFNPHMGMYTLKPATDAGVKKMFIWYPLQYFINIAKFAARGEWGVTSGNQGVAGASIYQARKVLNDLWCDTQISIYSVPEISGISKYTFRYTLPLNDDDIWAGTKSVTPVNIDPNGRFVDVQALALQAGITKTVQIARLFKSWAGDTGPLAEDCATIVARGTTFIQGLTAYTGNLSYIPYDPSIFTTTGSTVTTQLASLSNNYEPTLQTETGRYTRAYTNANVPIYNRYDSTKTPNGALSNCSNPMITQIVALTGSDTNIGQWIRTSGFNLAFGWKVGDARVADGRSISPGSTTYQATVLNNANTILSEISTHVPFERYGWTITACEFGGYTSANHVGFEPINDGKYLGSAWYNNGVISMMHALGTAGMTTGLETKLRGLLEGEVYGLVENWREKYGWYTKGQLTGMPVGSGQPNTNQWIEPAAALLNISLYLGTKKFLPSYNLGVALLAEAFHYEGDDGGFAEGFGYAQQTVGEMVNSINYMVATGDTRLVDPVKFPFLQNYWQWAIDCQLPGNYIINCQDNRGSQQADYTIGYYWPSILASALSYQGNTALANFKYLFPKSLPDLQGLQYTIAAQGITAALTIPNYKFYPDKQQVIWRTGRDKPSIIGNPYDVGLSTFGNTATPHYAIWAKGSSVKEGHKHTDQAHISVYQGYKVILMECGVDYETSNPALINPIDTLQQATGHNMMQVDAVDKSVVVYAPITVAALGATTGNITINGTCAYTNINNCTRNIIWNSNGFNHPLTVTISDNFNKTTGVTAGLEVYRFHTGNTDGMSITGSGTSWTASWDNVTIGITSNFSITVGQTGFNDFTQLVKSGTNLGNARVHKMLNISTLSTITAGVTFSLSTTLVVQPTMPINAFAWSWPGNTGNDDASLNIWNANANLFNYVSPLAFFSSDTVNQDWKT